MKGFCRFGGVADSVDKVGIFLYITYKVFKIIDWDEH